MTGAALQTGLRRSREATVKEHVNAANRHDPDATVATFSGAKAGMTSPRLGKRARCRITMRSANFSLGMSLCFPTSISKPAPCDMVMTTFLLRFG